MLDGSLDAWAHGLQLFKTKSEEDWKVDDPVFRTTGIEGLSQDTEAFTSCSKAWLETVICEPVFRAICEVETGDKAKRRHLATLLRTLLMVIGEVREDEWPESMACH